MAIGMYPIPPPDPQILASIFGPKFSEDPDNMTPSPSSRSPRQSNILNLKILGDVIHLFFMESRSISRRKQQRSSSNGHFRIVGLHRQRATAKATVWCVFRRI